MNKSLSGINLRDALVIAHQVGCQVEHRDGTGEIKINHPNWRKCVFVNVNRKDCPRVISSRLSRLLGTD